MKADEFDKNNLLEKTAYAITKGETAAERCRKLLREAENGFGQIGKRGKDAVLSKAPSVSKQTPVDVSDQVVRHVSLRTGSDQEPPCVSGSVNARCFITAVKYNVALRIFRRKPVAIQP